MNEILNKIAILESINDHLHSELTYFDELLKAVGFEEGISSVKSAAAELLSLEDGI